MADGADDLGLDREARWQPDGAELVGRLLTQADLVAGEYTEDLLREAAAALTAAQHKVLSGDGTVETVSCEEYQRYVEDASWMAKAQWYEEVFEGDPKAFVEGYKEMEADLTAAQQNFEEAHEHATRLLQERDVALKRVAALEEALRELNTWVTRMPDAGFSSESPRWQWWHERPDVSRALSPQSAEEGEQAAQQKYQKVELLADLLARENTELKRALCAVQERVAVTEAQRAEYGRINTELHERVAALEEALHQWLGAYNGGYLDHPYHATIAEIARKSSRALSPQPAEEDV